MRTSYETHYNCSRELTLDWVSEEREELENLRVFDILVKQAGTKENDRSRGLTKDQSPSLWFLPSIWVHLSQVLKSGNVNFITFPGLTL